MGRTENDFYSDSKLYALEGPGRMIVGGDTEGSFTLPFQGLKERSVIVKEADGSNGEKRFRGAYLYRGYSLYDLLNSVVVKKPNEDRFSQVIDLYITIGNELGESAVFSWGEIYYPVNRHAIMIATKVSRIVPSKTGELWPLPASTRVVAAPDLISGRAVAEPKHISITTKDPGTPVIRDKKPLFSPEIRFLDRGRHLFTLHNLNGFPGPYRYETVFYGRGRGIHSTTPFSGALLRDILKEYFPESQQRISKGLFLVTGDDGYRGVFSYSEIMNRSDQSEVMVMERDPENDTGRFRLFSSADFFSDRAVKAIRSIDYFEPGE